MDKLSIKYEMAQLDDKNREFFDELTEDEKKKFSPYLMIRWGATVKGAPELQQYYLVSVNERLNKHFFDITREHRKLQWLMASTVSPGIGRQYHPWIAIKSKKDSATGVKKFLMTLYPSLKDTDADTLCAILSTSEIHELAVAHGYSDKEIKSMLK